MRVLRFEIPRRGLTELPFGAEIISVGIRFDEGMTAHHPKEEIHVWALCPDDDRNPVERDLRVIMTGDHVPDDAIHRGSAHEQRLGFNNGAPFVAHVFEVVSS